MSSENVSPTPEQLAPLPCRSWLVQRLQKPHRQSGQMGRFMEALSFGGGRRNGGLSDDAMSTLRQVFAFDYMGAAEFEWSAVPQALSTIAKARKNLTAGSFQIPLSEVKRPFMQRRDDAPEGNGTIYWIAPKAWGPAVEANVREWAREGWQARLKESTYLDNALRPQDDYDTRVCGWIELDNGFMFFTDREMWEQTCMLFGARRLRPVSGGES